MSAKNIHYQTVQLSEYFGNNRQKWDDFYPSEKWIFEQVAGPELSMGKVLDVGCAAGGLGLALMERFSVDQYTGVDINAEVIEIARARKLKAAAAYCEFTCGDILDIDNLPQEGFDHVVSLSCADWNVETHDIIKKCWRYVRKGGHFILTLRLTKNDSLFNLPESYQYIYYGNDLPENKEGIEKAPYVVINYQEAFSLLMDLKPRPAHIKAYGYWGPPSPTARTRDDRLVFAALAVRKGTEKDYRIDTGGELHLPVDLFYPAPPSHVELNEA
ncbi:MAG: class I SAM-dependent methyltransferase [Deltaproteobacteria bacterium]|nr:class I SAM-dependent methyltransferase [Deltaproteobacteria bacterium]